jgi:hypothetical protein
VPEEVCVELPRQFLVLVGSRAIEEGEWRLRKAAALVQSLALAVGNLLHREWLSRHVVATLVVNNPGMAKAASKNPFGGSEW